MSQGPEKGMRPRVKLCAIAKDEGAYLAHWVLHHLYFGFDEIHVCLNRTTDNSAAILDEIAKAHPSVTYSYYDWVDLLPPGVASRMQLIAYARELAICREKGSVDYICFLDIDEFWVSAGWGKSVQDCILEHGNPDSVSFLWANEPRQQTAFSSLSPSGKYRVTGQLKTLFRVDLNIDQVRVHIPVFGPDVRPLLAGGKEFHHVRSRDQLYQLQSGDTKHLTFFIIHRVCRSAVEYMHSLLRGNPEKRAELKSNRRLGFFGEGECNFEHKAVVSGYLQYQESLSEMMASKELSDLVLVAQTKIQDSRERFFEAFEGAVNQSGNKEALLRAVNGISDPQLDQLLDRLSV